MRTCNVNSHENIRKGIQWKDWVQIMDCCCFPEVGSICWRLYSSFSSPVARTDRCVRVNLPVLGPPNTTEKKKSSLHCGFCFFNFFPSWTQKDLQGRVSCRKNLKSNSLPNPKMNRNIPSFEESGSFQSSSGIFIYSFIFLSPSGLGHYCEHPAELSRLGFTGWNNSQRYACRLIPQTEGAFQLGNGNSAKPLLSPCCA